MLKVLVIEDSKFFASILRKGVERLGFGAVLVASRAAALAAIEEMPGEFFAALVDLHLPDSTQGEAVDDMIERGIPAIVFTGNFNDDLRDLVLSKGVVDYVTKNNPTNMDHALSMLRRLAVNGDIQILVVDDSKVSRMHFSRLLRSHRFRVLEAANGNRALELLEQHDDIRLAIVDFNMAEMDGCTLVEQIRRKIPRHQLAIIGQSAYGSTMLSARFMKAGASDFMNKPFIPEELFCRIYQNLELIEHIENLVGVQAQLEAAREEAEAATRIKSEFLAVTSHEIRTPMNGILGMTRLVLDGQLPVAQRERMETVRNSAEALLTVLDDILDFSKLEAGRLEFESLAFDLPRLLENVVELLGARARDKALTLTTTIAPQVPTFVIGDSGRLRQVLLNLVGNAIKFTERGGVTLSATLAEADQVEVSVTDTGIGIDAETQLRLFTSFTQADSSVARRFGGTGLGLAICKKLVECQGGAIGIESSVGQGSRFWIRLSLPATSAPAATAGEDRSGNTLPPLAILLAEDNLVNQKVAVGFLAKGCHQVTIAKNGREAVEHAKMGGFDLVLMDMQMPEMDGLEATRVIRALPGPCGQVPIIALTANTMRGDDERCRSAGMNDHVAKPIDPEHLFATMARVMAAAGAPNPPIALVDTETLDTLAQHIGAALLRDLARDFLALADKAVQTILSQVASGSLEELSSTAHELKSMAGHLGCTALCDHAAAIETAARENDDTKTRRLASDSGALWRLTTVELARIIPEAQVVAAG
jgi:signal transduction histidine kinase/HPt (histidine-containing phosphotransfer) domain-containing protein